MDARAGAISEAYEGGADETSVMKHAGHKNRQTSARYNRGLARTDIEGRDPSAAETDAEQGLRDV